MLVSIMTKVKIKIVVVILLMASYRFLFHLVMSLTIRCYFIF